MTCQSYTRRNIVRGTFVDIEMRERNVGLYQKYRDAQIRSQVKRIISRCAEPESSEVAFAKTCEDRIVA